MHVAEDLNWYLQAVVCILAGALAILFLVRKAALRYFVVDSSFDTSAADYATLNCRKSGNMTEACDDASKRPGPCAVCGLVSKKHCDRCKMVKYCSTDCQKSHWSTEHKQKCMDLQSSNKTNHTTSKSFSVAKRASCDLAVEIPKILKPSNKILFPYKEFVEFFNWDKLGYPPCGLLNCGNSCFANVVLQCLAYTRPLVAYLLEKGHRTDCQRDDWCFLCEFQTHVERAGQSLHPFSPMNILSRLPNIGGNLGYGKQEDAHEFMRFAIDTMQSVCLDEYGGEKAVHPIYRETTLIQHIFGGRLRSQVICAECNNVSSQFENMMDLNVEIHGDAGSLEECLDQFTAKERLHGDNMYKCDGCNDYVMAWKRLTVERAPNILTIALKRFQSGRFGKLNKRITFPETLDLCPYVSGMEDENDVYKLYAVIVHVDMLNASFFGHYICYIKDFRGNWYRVDDCKVCSVELDEVLSQGAYMLLYSRICAHSSCLLTTDLLKKEESETTEVIEPQSSQKRPVECQFDSVCLDNQLESDELSSSESSVELKLGSEEHLALSSDTEDICGDKKMIFIDQSLPAELNVEIQNTLTLPSDSTKVASPASHANQIIHRGNSLIDERCVPMEIDNFESSSSCPSTSINNTSSVNGSLMSEESTSSKNNTTCEEDEVKGNELPTSNGISEAVKKSNGESSVSKTMPLFRPGFLVKPPPRRRSGKPESKTSSEATTPRRQQVSSSNGGLIGDENGKLYVTEVLS